MKNPVWDRCKARQGEARKIIVTDQHMMLKCSPCRPPNRPAFDGTVPLFYQMSRVPLNHGNVTLFVRSRIL